MVIEKTKLPNNEVTFFSRGGQGGITACQLLAEAAFEDGYKDVMSVPQIGAERRGAPIRAFLIISQDDIRTISAVTNPDVVLVFDEAMLKLPPIISAIPKKNCKVIVNAESLNENSGLSKNIELYTFPGTSIAMRLDLTLEGFPLVNVPILGAFSGATNLVSMDSIETVLKNKWKAKAEKNIESIKLAYEKTVRVY
ncbi:pyruvate ferredoxin oxidoreductase gamma subunit [Desulfosarcina sp. BuS5]|uniref:2-oxoacid:acceptor oxidoreductase family protein n=1 Tax=Desulfosarcina sp. BuS5 TaxID=933262 RepID=UPI00054EDA75|nr:2-oxoacid:acceptor oxidoreductase family protein [Desulfosarcina sp. BuS5]WDN90292.1 pyruvate ferredoxin oxidoreductase gamma subunit [Desulfosarcina sp. BuS5]